MDSLSIISKSLHGNALERFWYNKTRIGGKTLKKALEYRYGNFEKVLSNGIYKYVKTEKIDYDNIKNAILATRTTYLGSDLIPVKKTYREFDKEGRCVYMFSNTTMPDGIDISTKIETTKNGKIYNVSKSKYNSKTMRINSVYENWVKADVDKTDPNQTKVNFKMTTEAYLGTGPYIYPGKEEFYSKSYTFMNNNTKDKL